MILWNVLNKNAQCCENAIMQFHGLQYLFNMKTLRKKLWTHFPGSPKNMHLTPWLIYSVCHTNIALVPYCNKHNYIQLRDMSLLIVYTIHSHFIHTTLVYTCILYYTYFIPVNYIVKLHFVKWWHWDLSYQEKVISPTGILQNSLERLLKYHTQIMIVIINWLYTKHK